MRDWMRWAILTAVAGWAPSSSRIANSSPDSRATMSGPRTQSSSRRETSRSTASPARWPRLSLNSLKRSTSRYSRAKACRGLRCWLDSARSSRSRRYSAVGQAGQRVVHDLVLELGLDLFAHRDLAAQFAGARLHALFELGVERVQGFGVAAALHAVGDLVGDEGQQFGVLAAVHQVRPVALHHHQAHHPVRAQQRRAQPAHRRGAAGVVAGVHLARWRPGRARPGRRSAASCRGAARIRSGRGPAHGRSARRRPRRPNTGSPAGCRRRTAARCRNSPRRAVRPPPGGGCGRNPRRVPGCWPARRSCRAWPAGAPRARVRRSASAAAGWHPPARGCGPPPAVPAPPVRACAPPR